MGIINRILGNDETGEATEDIFIPGQETEMEDPRFDFRKCSCCGTKLKEKDRAESIFGDFLVRNNLVCESCGKVYCESCSKSVENNNGTAICTCGAKLILHVIGD